MFQVKIQSERIDIATETANLASDGSAGASVVFCGYCRDEGGRLAALELEHYPGMAEKEIHRILTEAAELWPLISASVIHRFGKIAPGEEIVFSGCTSVHRHAAFEAGAYIMDFMKTRAPFWKREHLVDGTVGGWVDAKDSDLSATNRWHRL